MKKDKVIEASPTMKALIQRLRHYRDAREEASANIALTEMDLLREIGDADVIESEYGRITNREQDGEVDWQAVASELGYEKHPMLVENCRAAGKRKLGYPKDWRRR